eukprot:jgi/Botrbrau1/22129/Bobra.0206s0053.1
MEIEAYLELFDAGLWLSPLRDAGFSPLTTAFLREAVMGPSTCPFVCDAGLSRGYPPLCLRRRVCNVYALLYNICAPSPLLYVVMMQDLNPATSPFICGAELCSVITT